MALTSVVCRDDSARARAERLAARLDVPLGAGGVGGVRLIVDARGLSLGFDDPGRGKPYAVDFTSAAWRAKLARPLPRAHIFRRALGEAATLIDATAGFGGDAALTLGLGFTVTAVEKSPVVAALLEDGVARARREGLAEHFARLTLLEGDAVERLADLRADVVYLDPMFTKPKSTAKSPKEMQLLQEVLGPAEDEAPLFAAAWAAAVRRVVVKRALKGPFIARAPTHAFKGQSVRYDVYVKA